MRQDLTFALRQLIRQPALWAVAIGTLGIGLAAALAVFTLVNAVLLRPLPYPDADRLISLGRGWNNGFGNAAHRDVQFLRDHVRTCGPIAASVGGGGLNVVLQGRASHLDDLLISHQYFDALGVQPTWGRAFSSSEDVDPPPLVVILSERFVRQAGLDPATLVGSDITLAGIAHTIVGIVAARHTLSSDPDVFRPMGNDLRGSGQNLGVICRLASGATPATLDAELVALTGEARRQQLANDRTARAYSFISRHEREFGATRTPLLTLLVAVLLVLLVAAANTTGLLLVRAAGRRREIAVRTAIGASPSRVARALLVEGVVLAGLASTVGLAAAPLLVRGLLAAAPAYYSELGNFEFSGAVVLAAVALGTVVGVAVSLPPLLEVLRVNVRDALQEEGPRGTTSRRTVWLRQLLIGAETAVCAVLLVGALLLLRTFVNLMDTPLGFDPAGLVTARMAVQGPQYAGGERLVRFFEDGMTRLEQLPAVESASVAASLPGERALNLPAQLPDSDDPQRVVVLNWRYVTPNFFEQLRIRHVAGRPMVEGDRRGAAAVALVNEAMAKEVFGGVEQALGRRIAIRPIANDVNEPVREVVGVVGDTAGWSIGDPPRPLMYVPLAQVDSGLLRSVHAFFPPRWIVRTGADPQGAMRALETVVRELDPNQPFIDVRTVQAMMLNSISMQRFFLALLIAFATFAVAIAAVGVYAAYSYVVALRTPEIGVRLALGAGPGRILWQVLWRGLLLGAVAIVVGLAVALAASRILTFVLYGVTPADPLTYATVGLTLLATITVATLIPALRAARIDPLVAIRR
jgi:putative ABC transport system permease protein